MARRIDTEAGFAEFLRAYPREMALSTEEPAAVFDRHHAPDAEYLSDGIRLDRDRVIAHAGPARKNVEDCGVEVHDVVVGKRRAAAHYTLVATTRKGKQVVTSVSMFADLAPDGRVEQVRQTTTTTTP